MNKLVITVLCCFIGWGAVQAQELKPFSGDITPALNLKDLSLIHI